MAIKRTGEQQYQIQWYDFGGRFRKRTFKGITKEIAERLERQILRERDLGQDFHDPRRAPDFTAAADAWVNAHKARWKPNTLRTWETVLSGHLKPAWGSRRVSTLTEQDGHELMARLKTAGLGPSRSNCALQVAKAILAYAVRQKWLQETPLTHVRGFPAPKTRVDPLSPAEIDLVLSALPPFWRPWFVLSAWTGLRPSEEAALAWGDVQAATGTFRVEYGLNAGRLTSPKTAGSVRDVDLLPPVLDALAQQRASMAALKLRLGAFPGERDYVFRTEQGHPVSIDSVRDLVWTPALKRAKLRPRPLYQLRHSFASNALAAGESPGWVAKMLGHANLTMIFQVYGRYLPNTTRRDGSALVKRMAGS